MKPRSESRILYGSRVIRNLILETKRGCFFVFSYGMHTDGRHQVVGS